MSAKAGRKIISFLFCMIFCSVALGTLVLQVLPPLYQETVLERDRDILPENYQAYIEGYQAEDEKLVPIHGDPQIGYLMPKRFIRTVVVTFRVPLESDTLVEIYYAGENEGLIEENSRKITVAKGETEAIIELPEGEYEHLRIDVNGPVSLANVYTSVALPVKVSVESNIEPLSFWSGIVFFVSFFAIARSLVKRRVAQYVKCSRLFALLSLFFISYIFRFFYFPYNASHLAIPSIPIMLFCICLFVLSCFEFGGEQKQISLTVICVVCMLLLGKIIPSGWFKNALYYVALLVIWVVFPWFFNQPLFFAAARCMKAHLNMIRKVAFILAVSTVAGILLETVCSGLFEQPHLWIRELFFSSTVFVLLIATNYRKELLGEPERIFLLVSLTFGVFLCVSQPLAMLVSWDDEIHYNSTLFLSQGQWTAFSEAERAVRSRATDRSLSISERANSVHAMTLMDTSEKDTVEHDKNAGGVNRIGYLPSAIGIWTGRILNAPFNVVLILGRIGNLLFYSFTMYFAMRRLINGKILLMIIALLPTNVFLACNYSYDPWVTACIALGVAYFMGSIQRPEEKLIAREAAIMVAAMMVGVLPKLAYFGIVLIPALMPNEKFKDSTWKKRFFAAVFLSLSLGAMLCIAPVVIRAVIAKPGALSDMRGGSDVNGVAQIKYILMHPFAYAKLMILFLKSYLSPENSEDYISYFAYLGKSAIHTVAIGLIWTATATDCVKNDKLSGTARIRALNIFILLATLVVCVSALYITFTPVQATWVAGFQYRYVLPFLLPFYLITCSNRGQFGGNRKTYTMLFSLASAYLLWSTIWTIIVKNVVP